MIEKPGKARPPKTIEDYMGLPEGVCAELISGELYRMSPSPTFRHQQVVTNVYRCLHAFVSEHALGLVCVAPLDVHLPSGDIVEPDVLFVSSANRHIVRDWIRGVPDLVVEVVSPERAERDRIVKRDLYARNGVSEYWIVETETASVEVLSVAGRRYASRGYFEEGDTITSGVLARLAVPVREVMAG